MTQNPDAIPAKTFLKYPKVSIPSLVYIYSDLSQIRPRS